MRQLIYPGLVGEDAYQVVPSIGDPPPVRPPRKKRPGRLVEDTFFDPYQVVPSIGDPPPVRPPRKKRPGRLVDLSDHDPYIPVPFEDYGLETPLTPLRAKHPGQLVEDTFFDVAPAVQPLDDEPIIPPPRRARAGRLVDLSDHDAYIPVPFDEYGLETPLTPPRGKRPGRLVELTFFDVKAAPIGLVPDAEGVPPPRRRRPGFVVPDVDPLESATVTWTLYSNIRKVALHLPYGFVVNMRCAIAGRVAYMRLWNLTTADVVSGSEIATISTAMAWYISLGTLVGLSVGDQLQVQIGEVNANDTRPQGAWLVGL